MNALDRLLAYLGLYDHRPHPCQEAFRMPPLTPTGAALLRLHIDRASTTGGSWGR